MGQIKWVFGQQIDLNEAFGLFDDAPFGYASAARGRKRILPPETARAVQQRLRRLKPPKPPAIQNLLARARQLKELLDFTPRLTRSALARELKLDPSRITQILNLLTLAPRIQKHIEALPLTKHHCPIGDDEWMRLARIRDHALQLKEFEILLAARKDHFTTSPNPKSRTVPPVRELSCA